MVKKNKKTIPQIIEEYDLSLDWLGRLKSGYNLTETSKVFLRSRKKEIKEHLKSSRSNVGKYIRYTIMGFILLILLTGSFYTIKAGERGVILTFGKPSMIAMDEGLHFKVPLIQKIIKMEVKTQKIETNADSASKDLQDVQTTIALNFHLSPAEVPVLYQEIGKSYRERIIDPAIQESVKKVTAEYIAEELITKRPKVRADMQETLRVRLRKYYIIVDDFNIVNFQFSEEFDKAIEAKVTAEQKALEEKNRLEVIKYQAQQFIEQGKGEAEKIRIVNEQLQQSPDYINYLLIQKWDGVMPLALGGGTLLSINPKEL